MMRLVTWNIQCGKGCDGKVDLGRIVATARALADADVFCFQEVADNFERLGGGADQSAELAALLPDHRPVFRPAIETVDERGGLHRFGNMTFSRLPVLQIENHLLPWPGTSATRSMRRQALDTTVRTGFGPLRVVNIHLEFHSERQRMAQLERLLALQEEASCGPRTAKAAHREPYGSQTRAASSLLCGDFNFDVGDVGHDLLQRAQRRGFNYRDAWTVRDPDRPRAPTCGIFDRAQWADGPDCRDFIFVSEDIAGRVVRIDVDTSTDASDHQPLVIEIDG
jgi:endonuclease/exonuclease/phosphatase family metal-dependent hydrolase